MRVRWMRTALTCLGILLGVSVILAISITNDSTLQSIRSVFEEASGKSSLLVQSSSADGGGFDESIVARVQNLDGVIAAAPAAQATTLLARDAKDWQIAFGLGGISAGTNLQLLGVDPAIDATVRQYDITAGRWIEGENYEAVLTEKYAGEKNLKVGDDLVILVPGGVERLKIVGLISRNGAGLLNDGVIAFAPLPVVQDLFGRGTNIDAVDVVVDPDIANSPDRLDALKEQAARRLGKDYEVSYPASRGQLVTQMLSVYQQGLSFFSVVALFVGAFLIYNAFSMTVLERTREIGLLRALGMTRAQILELVLAEAVILGVIGSALGVGFGVVLARGLIWMLGGVVATDINTITVPAEGLLQSLMVGGMVTMGSALLPARQAARVSPLEALRVGGRPGNPRTRRVLWFAGLALIFVAWAALYRIPFRTEFAFSVGSTSILILLFGATLLVPAVVGLAERLARPAAIFFFGNEGMLGSGNVRRSAGRTSLTVASLMVGLAMVIANNSLAAAFIHDITAWVETALGGDLYVRAPLPMREQFERQLAALPGVEGITKIRYFGVKVAPSAIPEDATGEDTIIYAAIDPDTYRAVGEFEFAANQGDPDANWARFKEGGALFISTVVADRYHVQQGDTLRLVTRRGEHDFYVAAVAVDFTGQGFIVTGAWDDMRRWFSQSGVDRFTISLAPGYTTDEVRKTIEDKYQASRNVSVETTQEFKQKVLTLSQESFRLFDVLGLIGVVVAALGVINTLMMNVIERQREIGGLRSLGLTRWQTTKMVLAEAATLGVIGGAFGMGFGYFLSQIFVMSLNELAGYDLQYLFTLNSFLTGAVIAFVVSQVAAAYPAWKAAGVNVVEAIKHE
jgi:putative ABC transport system permease protein